jgi:hypothetical protein
MCTGSHCWQQGALKPVGLSRFPFAPHATWFVSPVDSKHSHLRVTQRHKGRANRAVSTALAGGEVRDLVTLPADLKVSNPI